MNDKENYFVSSYNACSEEDDYNNGITGESCSCWTSGDLPVAGNFASPADAIKEFCHVNGFTYNPEWWENDPIGEDDFGRYDTDIMVDENNAEASEDMIAEWREDKRKLWNCHVSLHIHVRYIRNLTEAEAKLGKEG